MISVLAVIVIFGVVFFKGPQKAEALPLTVYVPADGSTYYTYSVESMDLVDENLLEPLRGTFGIESPDDAFSRCSSIVDYTIDSPESTDGYYYGNVTKIIGCGEESGNYPYRVEAETGNFEMQNSDGSYTAVEDWEVPTEE